MDVLALTTSYPTSKDDIRGRFVFEWALAMQSLGVNIHVVGPAMPNRLKSFPYTGYWHAGDLLMQDGAPEHLARNPIRNAMLGAAISMEMARVVRRFSGSDDLIVAHWLLPSVMAAVAAGIGIRKAIHGYAHGGDIALLETLPKPIARITAKTVDERTAGITFVSSNLQERFNALLDRKPKARQSVIPMGITRPKADLEFGRYISEVANGRHVIATIGRMVKIKGLDTLLDALKSRSDVLWIAAGSGPERTSLIDNADGAGVALLAPGQIRAAEREALLNASTLFVQPSRPLGNRQEGSPVALSEALAAGVPSIVSTTGGMVSVGQMSQCYMVPCNDSQALRNGINHLFSHPAQREVMAKAHRAFGRRLCWDELGQAHRSALEQSRSRPA